VAGPQPNRKKGFLSITEKAFLLFFFFIPEDYRWIKAERDMKNQDQLFNSAKIAY